VSSCARINNIRISSATLLMASVIVNPSEEDERAQNVKTYSGETPTQNANDVTVMTLGHEHVSAIVSAVSVSVTSATADTTARSARAVTQASFRTASLAANVSSNGTTSLQR
jgi:HD-like signal output (HDOD) protein